MTNDPSRPDTIPFLSSLIKMVAPTRSSPDLESLIRPLITEEKIDSERHRRIIENTIKRYMLQVFSESIVVILQQRYTNIKKLFINKDKNCLVIVKRQKT